MGLLFVNACMRDESRTLRLARRWLASYEGAVQELSLLDEDVRPLAGERLKAYYDAVATADYSSDLFGYAKQFAQADEVLIAAPFWNFSVPAKLHDYLELVCSQGVTFDIDERGSYVSLCRLRRLTFVTTAGGVIDNPNNDHAFAYVRTLAREFWHVPLIECIMAEGLDASDADVDALLRQAL